MFAICRSTLIQVFPPKIHVTNWRHSTLTANRHIPVLALLIYSGLSCCKHSTKSSSSDMPCEENVPRVLKFSKVVPDAFPPLRASAKAAGYDLRSAVDNIVPGEGKAVISTGLKIELPDGCYGRIAPRSGLAVNHFIDVGAGVVDQDYRGVIKVVLFNHSHIDFTIRKGDRIAQLICEQIFYPEIEEVQELSETGRGDGGFGSTGVN